ncbi:MAG: hypothetical protein GC162_05535 [Planctomycetes bacterium]|nr:hypothetical protein [Planctomycetota bacterium]
MSTPTTPAQTVYLITSSSTAWQAADRMQGDTDLPATESGLAVVRAGASVAPPESPVGTIWCAEDEASRQTAELVARVWGEAKVKHNAALAEMNLGLWQGLTTKDLTTRYPTAFNQWLSDPANVSPPQGESLESAEQRLMVGLGRLLNRAAGDPTAIVLRPMMLAITRSVLLELPITESLNHAQRPVVERIDLASSLLRHLRSGKRPKSAGRISA